MLRSGKVNKGGARLPEGQWTTNEGKNVQREKEKKNGFKRSWHVTGRGRGTWEKVGRGKVIRATEKGSDPTARRGLFGNSEKRSEAAGGKKWTGASK